jgi:hypothetical protein
MKKSLLALTLALGVWTSSFMVEAATPHKVPNKPTAVKSTAAKPAPADKSTEPQKGIVDTSYEEIDPLKLLQETDNWVGKKVSFTGDFVTFSPYALDYKAAMRASKDYIAFLIRRPDVTHHTIPLSELKLIYPRKKVDKVTELENGDTIVVKGKVFSAALGDPWLDVDDVVLVKKSPENLAKAKNKPKKNELE